MIHDFRLVAAVRELETGRRRVASPILALELDRVAGQVVCSVYSIEEGKEVAFFGESRGRSFGLVRLDLLLQIDPFASVQELVTS